MASCWIQCSTHFTSNFDRIIPLRACTANSYLSATRGLTNWVPQPHSFWQFGLKIALKSCRFIQVQLSLMGLLGFPLCYGSPAGTISVANCPCTSLRFYLSFIEVCCNKLWLLQRSWSQQESYQRWCQTHANPTTCFTSLKRPAWKPNATVIKGFGKVFSGIRISE